MNRLTDRPGMTKAVYHGRKATRQKQQKQLLWLKKVAYSSFLEVLKFAFIAFSLQILLQNFGENVFE